MKVLEKKEWEKTFTWQCTCPQCESKLEVESNDLNHEPGGGDQRESWPEKFSVRCAVCSQNILVPTNTIPKYVQKLARDRRNSRGGPYDR